MNYSYPFVYDVPGDRRGFLPIGMKIREHYLRWVDTSDYKHLDSAVPLIALFVGRSWKNVFAAKQMDQDILDPVAYRIIFKYLSKDLPTEHSFAHFLRVMTRRAIVRAAYKTYIPEEGDKSIRSFTYHPFNSPADIEHNIFLKEITKLLLEHIEHNTRFDERKRKACRYLAEVLILEKLPSPLMLRDVFGIPYNEQQFYLDFTTVVLRNELYKIRESVPQLYGNERAPFVAVFRDEEEDDELEEAEDQEEDIQVCDL